MISKLKNPEVVQFIQSHLDEDPAELMLNAKKHPELPMKHIAGQIASRRQVRDKLPEWYGEENFIFPPKSNLEQASSELTGRYKASLFSGIKMADLTGGTGVDCWYMSEYFDQVVYVEPNKDLCEIFENNASIANKSITVVNSTAEDFLKNNTSSFDLIYIDPSRRDDRKNRLIDLKDYSPNVVEMQDGLFRKSGIILIKVSPMMDLKTIRRTLEKVCRIHVLAVQNEVKEILIEIRNDVEEFAGIRAVNLIGDQLEAQTLTFHPDEG